MFIHLNKLEDLVLIFPIINGKVSMAINRLMYRNFKKKDLQITPEQWTVLAFLWKQDGVTQQVLCNSTFKDKPSMTRLLDNLEKQKLVTRSASKTDRRSNLIFLTKAGKEIEEVTKDAVSETMQTALQGIDEAGMDRLRSVLALVFNNIANNLENENDND